MAKKSSFGNVNRELRNNEAAAYSFSRTLG